MLILKIYIIHNYMKKALWSVAGMENRSIGGWGHELVRVSNYNG
ncbi:Uncharacterised protein [uncultured archaeon]|nr:Uncharacterised protein [uncultured archaeon]